MYVLFVGFEVMALTMNKFSGFHDSMFLRKHFVALKELNLLPLCHRKLSR
jgi:hypothetical protein